MALQNMNPGGALGIGQMLGRRMAPFSGGPGMPLSVQQAGGRASGMPGMAAAPAAAPAIAPAIASAIAQGGGQGLAQQGGLLAMLVKDGIKQRDAAALNEQARGHIQNGSPINSSAMMQSLFNTQSQGFGGDGSGMGLTNLLQFLSSYPGGGA